MKRRYAAALLALVVPASLATSAHAGTFTDPSGDVRDLGTAQDYPDAPRASIDHTVSIYSHVKVNGRPGTRLTIHVKDLLSKTEAPDYAQMIVPHMYYNNARTGKLTSALVTAEAGKKVLVASGGANKPCPYATRKFNFTKDVVTLFVPDACFPAPIQEALTTTYLQDSRHTINLGFDDANRSYRY